MRGTVPREYVRTQHHESIFAQFRRSSQLHDSAFTLKSLRITHTTAAHRDTSPKDTWREPADPLSDTSYSSSQILKRSGSYHHVKFVSAPRTMPRTLAHHLETRHTRITHVTHPAVPFLTLPYLTLPSPSVLHFRLRLFHHLTSLTQVMTRHTYGEEPQTVRVSHGSHPPISSSQTASRVLLKPLSPSVMRPLFCPRITRGVSLMRVAAVHS